jgi:hypothetical protein
LGALGRIAAFASIRRSRQSEGGPPTGREYESRGGEPKDRVHPVTRESDGDVNRAPRQSLDELEVLGHAHNRDAWRHRDQEALEKTASTCGRRGPHAALTVRLPREASPAKVAKDGQHNDNDDDPKPGRHVDPSFR